MIRGDNQAYGGSEYNGIPGHLMEGFCGKFSQAKPWKMVVEILAFFSQKSRL